jgi:hypothetical protein
MPPPRQESVRKTLANILPCKPGAEGMALVLYAVGSISEKLANIRRRGDICLQSGQTLDVVIDGLPGEFTTSSVAAIFRSIDPSIDHDNLVRNITVLKPLISSDGKSIVSGKIKQLHITPAMANFFAGAPRHDLTNQVPEEFYVRGDKAIAHAVQIVITDDLRKFFKFLEALGCWKWQIEGLFQHLVQTSLPQRVHGVNITSLRIQTIQPGSNGPRRVPCSKGLRVIATVDNAEAAAKLQSAEIMMKLSPFPRTQLHCSTWENMQDSTQNPALTAKKEAEAKSAAAQCKPPRDVISRVELNFKVEAAPGFRSQQMPLSEMEAVFQEALGGVFMGISAVQLFPDGRGQVRLNGSGIIWVSDMDPDDRKVAKGLVDMLKRGDAACNTENLAKVGCRGMPVLIECGKEPNSVMTISQAAKVIARYLTSYLDTALVLTKPQGRNLPWIKRAGDDEMPLSALGALVPRTVSSDGPPVLDIRSLFPNPGPEVTVNMLCEAITSLVKTGNVSMYEADDDSGQTRYLVHLSASDSWAMPPSDGAAVGGSAAGAAAGGAARRDSMSD